MFNALVARRGVVVKYADLGRVGEKEEDIDKTAQIICEAC